METIDDKKRLEHFIIQNNIDKIFSSEYFDTYKKSMALVRFSKGEFIYKEKENINRLLFLVKGQIKVCSDMSNGKRQLLYFYNGSGTLGDLEYFNLSNPYTTIQVTETAYCISIYLPATKQLLDKDPTFLLYLGESLAQKLRKSSSNNALNIFYNLENRLCSYIRFTSTDILIEDIPRKYYAKSLSETSEVLGTSYRHLQRTLKSLCEKKIIEKYKKGYLILDEEALNSISLDIYL